MAHRCVYICQFEKMAVPNLEEYRARHFGTHIFVVADVPQISKRVHVTPFALGITGF